MASPAPTRRANLAPVVFVMGKGGVGKTTIAAGLAALDAEARGKGVFLEIGDGESGKRALAGTKGVEHVVVKPEEALYRAATPLFGSATLAKLALNNFAMKPMFAAAPLIRELAMLETIRQVAEERPGLRVVVDMPATGHGVAWLRVPKHGGFFLGSGPLYELCARVGRDILSPGKGSIVVVTLPEKLVVEETLELCATVKRDAGLDVDHVVVNRMPAALPADALDAAHGLAASSDDHRPHALALAEVLRGRATATGEAVAALAALEHDRMPIARVPLFPVDPSAREVAKALREEGVS